MAKGKKTGGRDFEVGNCASTGRPPVPPEIKEARVLNRVEFERIANKLLYMTAAQINEIVSDPKTTAIELAICTIIAKGAKEADPKRLAFLFDRLLGKPKQEIDLSNKDGSLKPLIYIPNNGRD